MDSGSGITGGGSGYAAAALFNGARGIMSSVRYGIRLGDLKENWFLCFPIKHSTHTGTHTFNLNSTILYGRYDWTNFRYD